MSPSDRALLQQRSRELVTAAAIYGYDLAAGNWSVDQAVCPVFPGTLMLHYQQRYPDGSESRFTALLSRSSSQVRIVPSLHKNAADFLPAARNPHNYALFNRLVPASLAAQSVDPAGKWLVYAVCYAEMVGAQPNVPDDPGLDVALVHAPPSTFRMDAVTHTRQVQFPDRESANAYAVWTLSLNKNGRIAGASVEDASTFTPQVVRLQEPAGKILPNPAQPTARMLNPTENPKITVSSPPSANP